MKKTFFFFLRTGISIALLVFLFKKVDLKSTAKVIGTAQPLYLVSALFCFLLLEILLFYRWKMLLTAQGIALPSKSIINAFCGSMFFNLFLPSSIGGDVARSLNVSLHTKRKSVAVASVLLDRLSGFVGLVAVALFSLIVGSRFISEPLVYVILFCLTLLLAGFFIIIFNQRIYRKLNSFDHKKPGFLDAIRKLHAELYFFRAHPVVLYRNLFYSIVIQCGASFVSYLLLRALKVKINIIFPFVLSPLIAIITALPVSIGGMGLREVSSVFFYTKAGIAKDIALGQSILNFAIVALYGLIAGIIYVSTLHYRRLQPDQTDAPTQ